MALITPSGTATSKKSIAWKTTASALALGLAFCFPGWWTALVQGSRAEKRIALTLDDGPNPPYTEKFLQLLERESVVATFFVLGRNLEIHPETAARLAQSGHEIGNHSYSHADLRWSWWGTGDEIRRTDGLIRAFGYEGAIPFRAPFGRRYGLHAWWLWLHGRANYLYDVEPIPADYLRSDPEAMARSAQQRTQNGSIVLFHDGEGMRVESLEAVARLIPLLRARGFQFVKMSELAGTPLPP